MMLTKSFTQLGVATATFAAVGSFMTVNAETAAAASFTVEADIFLQGASGGSFDIGDVFGSFDYDFSNNNFSNISLTSKFSGLGPFFPAFTTTYNTFVDGSIDTLTAKVAGANIDGISLVFPELNKLTLGSPAALKAGSVTLITQQFELSAPVQGSITAVPTPALLPGLIGLGVAALRRKNEESAEENA